MPTERASTPDTGGAEGRSPTWVLGLPQCTFPGTSKGLNRAGGEDFWWWDFSLAAEMGLLAVAATKTNSTPRTGKKLSALPRVVAGRGPGGQQFRSPECRGGGIWDYRGGPRKVSSLWDSRSHLNGAKDFWTPSVRKSLAVCSADFGTQTEPPG